jgi:YidC/Oxa1 family membrane protein insertase
MMWRIALFLIVAMAILSVNEYVRIWLYPPEKVKPQAQRQVAQEKEKVAAVPPNVEKAAPAAAAPAAPVAGAPAVPPAAAPAVPAPGAPAVPAPGAPAPPPVAEAPAAALQWGTLGSADSHDPYQMLVTWTNRGAAVVRIELNSDRYLDMEDRHGYLGEVVLEPALPGAGAKVQVVGRETPAVKAGLKQGDLITSLGSARVTGMASLKKALSMTEPGQKVTLSVDRGGKPLSLSATLVRKPLAVIHPEEHETPDGADPLSFLFTLHEVDQQKLPDPEKPNQAFNANGIAPRPADLDTELKGLNLRGETWDVVKSSQTEVVFRRRLSRFGLEVQKTYRLAKKGDKSHEGAGYHLTLGVEIRNTGDKARQVAYQLDGPNGLPDEGYWYASKVSPNWGGAGIRDVVLWHNGIWPEGKLSLYSASNIGAGTWGTVLKDKDALISYMGVDAQYFSVVMIPQHQDPSAPWIYEAWPTPMGPVDKQSEKQTNSSFRLVSTLCDLKPGRGLSQDYEIFAGPKQPALLAQYGLKDLVVYGWFFFVAEPMSWILHFFYAVVRNYGLAIIMLTVVVRLCMFPLSRKQTLNAQKMQELQPEIKRIQEAYKNNMEGRTKAQQELFRKHNYNPLGGCLLVFLQLPIFLGLYRSLMVDVELRQAPLISESVRWCSNLAAPDMLFNWSSFMLDFLASDHGYLGPYFNVLPLIVIALFIWQQKKLMPPAVDEQAAMQQKMMMFMTVFMGVLFYKVASGLCLYFIASSLWSLAERKFLPKTGPVPAKAVVRKPPNGGGGTSQRKKSRDRR